MKKLFTYISGVLLSFLLTAYSSQSVSAAGPARIDVEEQTVIYCVSASTSARGVFTLPISGSADNATKISGSTYIQYDFYNSGGTFVDTETVYGTKNASYSYYAGKATAAGTADGPWAHTFWAYRIPSSPYTNYTKTIIATDMVYDPVTEKIYGWFCAGQYSTNWRFCSYSGESAASVAATPIGSETATKITAMAIDAEGTIWGIAGGSGDVYTIDKTNGALTKQGSLGLYYTGDNQSAAIDQKTGKLYWGARNDSGGYLYEVDLKAMTATKVYDFPSGKIYNAFYIPAPAPSKNAPSEITDLAAKFTGTGTDVKVTFTAPTKNTGGGDLSGPLTYKILIDGEAPATDATGTIEAGATFDKNYTMTKGEHTVAVTVSNDDGESPKATVEVYAGFDSPKAVTDLSVTTDNNSVVVSWTASESLNGGILDSENISYTVTRKPGNVVVVDKTKELSVTDVIPDSYITGYTYTVTVYDGDIEGPSATSAMLMLGKPYTIPYTQNFNEGELLSDLGFVSTSDDTRLTPWTLSEFEGEKAAVVVAPGSAFPHSYALFTPLAEYKTDVVYTMNFKLAYSEAVLGTIYIDVFLCNKQAKDAADIVGEKKTITIVGRTDEMNANVKKFVDYSFTFDVPADGTYSVCIFDNGSFDRQAYNLAIDDIEITGEYPTPLPAENLEAAPVDEGSRDIKLTFTLPEKALNGKDLKSISKVEVLSGNEVVGTIDDSALLTPGNTVEYTVADAPRGNNTYTVVVFNGELASEPSNAVTAFSGYLNNLKIVATSFPEQIAIDAKGTVDVEIINDGYETAADYTVELINTDENSSQKLEGVQLASDDTHTYSFEIEWDEALPEAVTYSVAVVFADDQNSTDNITDNFTVTFEQKPEDGISAITADGAVISAADGRLTIKGNAQVSVYDLEGHKLAAAKVSGSWSKQLAAGVYLVTVGDKTYKVAL